VFGNGDIETVQDARRMREETNCDGLMIGRAAMGNPWIFGDVLHYLQTGHERPAPTLDARMDAAVSHLKRMAETPHVGETRAVKEMRGQITHYFKGFPGVSSLRGKLVVADTIAHIEDILHDARHYHPDH